MPCACLLACAAEEVPRFLVAALQKAVFAALSARAWQGRVGAAQQPAAPPGFTPAASAVKTLHWPRAAHVCQLMLLSLGVVMGHTGGEEKKLSWFQENFVEKHDIPSQAVVCYNLTGHKW